MIKVNHTDNIFLILLHEKNIKRVNFPQETQKHHIFIKYKTVAAVDSQAHLNGAYCLCLSMHSFFQFLIHIFIVTAQWENGLPSATNCQLENDSIT